MILHQKFAAEIKFILPLPLKLLMMSIAVSMLASMIQMKPFVANYLKQLSVFQPMQTLMIMPAVPDLPHTTLPHKHAVQESFLITRTFNAVEARHMTLPSNSAARETISLIIRRAKTAVAPIFIIPQVKFAVLERFIILSRMNSLVVATVTTIQDLIPAALIPMC
jgi:hypothetical protein